MVDNYENLGFQVNVEGADSAVSRLDSIITRLERIQQLEGKKALDGSNSAFSKSLSEEEKYAKKINNKTKLLNSSRYQELRTTELLNKERQKEIDQRIKQKNGINDNTNALSKYVSSIYFVSLVTSKMAQFTSEAIKESAKYIENLNLFAVAYKDTYEQQIDFVLELADAYGLANNEVLKFAGTFRELSSSLGMVEDTADTVSKVVTQLGYDLSALFNTSVEQAMEKLQSGIFSGQVRPLRAFGIDISQGQIDELFKTNEELAKLGINARNLSQSDKAIARLIITLQSANDSYGTMAREINNLQSQFRIFEGSIANLKLAFGDLIAEPLSDIMVFVNAAIIALTDLIRGIVPLNKEDETPFTNYAKDAEKTNEEVEKLESKLAGFDKFNVLQDGGGTTGNSTDALNKLLQEQANIYDEKLSKSLEEMENRAKNLAEQIKPLVAALTALGVSLVPKLVIKGYSDLTDIFKKFNKTASQTPSILLNGQQGLNKIKISADQVVTSVGALVSSFFMADAYLNTFEGESKKAASWATFLIGAIMGLTAAIVAMNTAGSWGTMLPVLLAGVGMAIAGVKGMVSDVKGFANGGYTNANLIMTHENGKREWVGKAAGSSAIVNDTQMSDIMEGAVAKGVYRALSTDRAYGNATTDRPIVIKIGEEQVFRAVRTAAKRQGKDFASV